MKNIFFLILSSLFIIGCFSSNYTVKDFKSKEDFNKNFNNFAKDKEVNVNLKKDSTITAENGGIIHNDSFCYKKYLTIKKENSVALKTIKDIQYKPNDYKSAKITLNNGKEFHAENINVIPDSMIFTQIMGNKSVQNCIPLSEIKQINSKNRWKALPAGLLWGTVTGLVVGALGIFPIYQSHPNFQGGQSREYDSLGSTIIGMGLGIILGSAIALIIGYNTNYYF